MVDDSEFLRDAGMRPEGIAGRDQGMPPLRPPLVSMAGDRCLRALLTGVAGMKGIIIEKEQQP